MYLSSFEMTNVKSFDHLRLEFINQDNNVRLWTCLMGENGIGKTTILQAIASQLTNDPNFYYELSIDFRNWISKNKKESMIQSKFLKNQTKNLFFYNESHIPTMGYPNYLEYWRVKYWGRPIQDLIKFNIPHGLMIIKPVEETEKQIKNLSCGYGPFRRLSGGSLDTEKILEKENLASSFVTLFREDAALTNVKQWLVDLYNTGREGDEANQKKLKIVSAILESKLFPERTKLHVNATSAMIEMVDMDGLKLPIQALSDGYRSMLALVVDMVRWAMKANPAAENPLLEPGVVLIDELDAHLHPKWQQRIGVWLRETFPNVQFIIATHSPFLAQVYPEGNHILYRNEETGRIEVKKGASEAADWRIDQVLTGIFDLPSTRSLEFERKRQKLDALRQKHFEGPLPEDEARRLEELEAWSKKVPHLEGSMQRLADHFDHLLKNKLAAQEPPAP